MKIGMATDSLGHLSFREMLDVAARMGVKNVEFNAANWTSAHHINIETLLAHAGKHGVTKLVVELHGNQLVHNIPSPPQLCKEIGSIVGANLDPSHLMWMGADPLAANAVPVN